MLFSRKFIFPKTDIFVIVVSLLFTSSHLLTIISTGGYLSSSGLFAISLCVSHNPFKLSLVQDVLFQLQVSCLCGLFFCTNSPHLQTIIRKNVCLDGTGILTSSFLFCSPHHHISIFYYYKEIIFPVQVLCLHRVLFVHLVTYPKFQ